MRFVLVFLIVAMLFFLATILVMKATAVELPPGWYLVPSPSTHA